MLDLLIYLAAGIGLGLAIGSFVFLAHWVGAWVRLGSPKGPLR